MTPAKPVTAGLLIIGDEILSGRTKDKNIGCVADFLTVRGVDLCEVRVVRDVIAEIVAALDALRHRYTYVFTTGGIGPTHDDVTAEAVGLAFGLPVVEDARAIALLMQKIQPDDLNAARRRMARMPHGAELIENSVSKAPGFRIGNVIVMAGVPVIVEAMLAAVGPSLEYGAPTLARSIAAGAIPEGAYAAGLSVIATQNPELSIGSYPSVVNGRFANEIVVRGKTPDQVAAVAAAIENLLADLRAAGRDTYTIT